ncbi:MAG: hypothetical protein ABMA64_02415 [Myxococcota bacterium]
MDALWSIGCLLAGSALPLAGLFAVARRGMRQLQVATAYGDVARQLALEVDTRGVSLQGYLGDQRLWVGEVMVGYGPERRMACWGVLDHERPLGLGLSIRRRGLSERLFRRPRGVRITSGFVELDRRVEINGDEPELVQQLLDEQVREALASMMVRWRDLVVSDHSVRVILAQPPSRPEELRDLVHGMRVVSGALASSRRQVAPPTALRSSVERWSEVAERLGLGFDACYPGVAGELEGRAVRVTPVRTAEGYAAELRMGFRAHHRTGLRLRRQLEPDGYWSVGQDIQVSDGPFDQRFVVKGYDPEAIRDLLSSVVREGLLALDGVGDLDLDDHRLHLARLPLHPTELVPIVVQAARTADAMGW